MNFTSTVTSFVENLEVVVAKEQMIGFMLVGTMAGAGLPLYRAVGHTEMRLITDYAK